MEKCEYNIVQVNYLLQTQVLSIRQADESCIRLTQENSIEDSV